MCNAFSAFTSFLLGNEQTRKTEHADTNNFNVHSWSDDDDDDDDKRRLLAFRLCSLVRRPLNVARRSHGFGPCAKH